MAVLLDTNLLLLWVVGSVDTSLIGRHKRLKAYRPANYAQLQQVIGDPAAMTTLPNIATEASNLLGPGDELCLAMGRMLATMQEHYVPSKAAVRAHEFAWLGVTDAAILLSLHEPDTLVTADVRLWIAAQKRGLRAINFNRLLDQ